MQVTHRLLMSGPQQGMVRQGLGGLASTQGLPP